MYAGKPPVVLVNHTLVLALDVETGARIWEWTAPAAIVRVLKSGDRLFFCATPLAETHVHCLRLADGAPVGVVKLDFAIDAALSQEDRMFFAGPRGAACVAVDGAILWTLKYDFASERLLELNQKITCRDAGGATLWDRDFAGSNAHPAIVVGDRIVQSDFTGRH